MNLFTDNATAPGRPYWWEHGEPLPELATQLPSTTDLLVVGAGYTGLNAALTLAKAGVAMAPYLGMKVGQQVLFSLREKGSMRNNRKLYDGQTPDTAYTRTHLTSKAFHWGGRPYFLALAELWSTDSRSGGKCCSET